MPDSIVLSSFGLAIMYRHVDVIVDDLGVSNAKGLAEQSAPQIYNLKWRLQTNQLVP